MGSILVTGGAGYIGSHMVYTLLDEGHDVVILDNLSTGSRFCLAPDTPFIEAAIQDLQTVEKAIRDHKVETIIHFAGSIQVGESVEKPLDYYENNTAASLGLARLARDMDVENFIFSSTAAVYGEPKQVPVTEDSQLQPINPYGWSKLMTEQMLRDMIAAPGTEMRAGILRYFNVAGADPKLRTGQVTINATHLIKVAVEVLTGKRDSIGILGDDYPTPDGTGIRDYIHVTDLARAHIALLDHLKAGTPYALFNCGYGKGASVREVITALEEVAGRSINPKIAPRRAGDPAKLVADVSQLRTTTGWQPRHDDLAGILRSAWDWERKLAER